MNPDNDSIYEFEGQYYQSPTSSRDETLGFVESLRNMVGSDTADIARQTTNLGTDIPSNLGGLGGSGTYFAQRYQTTPVEAQINTLRATAQADALNKLMKNELAQSKKRYQDAYNTAQRRASSGGYGGGGDGTGDGEYGGENPETYYADSELEMPLEGWGTESNVTGYGLGDGYKYYKNQDTGKMIYTNNPNYILGSDNYYYSRDAMMGSGSSQTVRTREGWKDRYITPTGEKVYFPAHSIKGYVGF